MTAKGGRLPATARVVAVTGIRSVHVEERGNDFGEFFQPPSPRTAAASGLSVRAGAIGPYRRITNNLLLPARHRTDAGPVQLAWDRAGRFGASRHGGHPSDGLPDNPAQATRQPARVAGDTTGNRAIRSFKDCLIIEDMHRREVAGPKAAMLLRQIFVRTTRLECPH